MNIYKRDTKSAKISNIKSRIRFILHTLYILTFGFVFVPSYKIEWPLAFPYFFYRDIFEYGLISVFVYILYFAKGKRSISRRIPLLVSLGTFMLIILSIIAYNKELYMRFELTSFKPVVEDVMQYIGFGCVLFLFFIGIDNIDRITSIKWYKNWEILKESRNQMLRQQFTPHFLFNALNSVYSMSLNEHPDTSDTILKLSGMMRYLTDEINVKRIPLDREIRFLQNYIALEKIRFSPKANILFNSIGETKGKLLEPLLLVPLVENAFKHGFNTNDPSAFVYIELRLEETRLRFIVRNSILSKKSDIEDVREGKGLDNLKKRLQINYGRRSNLVLSNQGGMYVAQLELKLDE